MPSQGPMPALRLIALAAAAVLPLAKVSPAEREVPVRTAPEPAAPSAPRPIALEQVFRAADELDAELFKAHAIGRADPALDAVERRLTASEAAIRGLATGRPQALDDASAREIER